MINEKWLAEFCGLFWGEGCADVQIYTSSKCKKNLYRPRLRIQLRADDGDILKDVHEKLGGTLTYNTHNSPRTNPSYQWAVANKEEVSWICKVLLEHGQMPSKKRSQVELVKEAADLRKGKLGWLTEGERTRLREIYEEVQKLKVFVPQRFE